MRHTLLTFVLSFFFLATIAQPETEVFLMNIATSENGLDISNFKNVSSNEGYDNQPSFMGTNNLLYAGTKNGATDIAVHNIPSGQNWWLNIPTEGGEYSPQIMPGQQAVSAVRLDPDGLQRFYRYPFGEKPSELLFEELQVAYYGYYDSNNIMASVLSDGKLDLVIANLQTKQIDTIVDGAGRSIHKVPNANSMSYTIVNEDGNHDLYLFDWEEKESYFVCEMPIGIQDYAWMDENRIIIGSNALLYVYDTLNEPSWQKVGDLGNYKIRDISRITVSADGKMMAIASASDALKTLDVIDKQVRSYNARDLEAFASCFAEDVSVRRFPNNELYSTRATLKAQYQEYYNNVKSTGVEVTNRIAINGTVIDAETATDRGKSKKQVAIYQVNNGEIKTMTFLFDQKDTPDPTIIVDKQLEAYNKRDIDAFVQTYTEDVQLFNYPNAPRSQGHDGMRQGYTDFFAQTPDLHCEIKNRIVIGNKVIDEEYITMNGTHFSAVAIYEVTNGLISKVTFIR